MASVHRSCDSVVLQPSERPTECFAVKQRKCEQDSFAAIISADFSAEFPQDDFSIPNFRTSGLNKSNSHRSCSTSSSLTIEAKLMGLQNDLVTSANKDLNPEPHQTNVICTFDELAAFALAQTEQASMAPTLTRDESPNPSAQHEKTETQHPCFDSSDCFGRTDSRYGADKPSKSSQKLNIYEPVSGLFEFERHQHQATIREFCCERNYQNKICEHVYNRESERRRTEQHQKSRANVDWWNRVGRSLRKSASDLTSRLTKRSTRSLNHSFARTSGAAVAPNGQSIKDLEAQLHVAFLEAQRSGFAVVTSPPEPHNSAKLALKKKGRQLHKLFAGCMYTTSADLEEHDCVAVYRSKHETVMA